VTEEKFTTQQNYFVLLVIVNKNYDYISFV